MQHTSVVGPAETGLLPVVALSSFLEGGAFLCSFPCLMSSKRELPCCPPIISSSISNSCWALRRRCDLSSSSYGRPISVLAAMAHHEECLQCTRFTVCQWTNLSQCQNHHWHRVCAAGSSVSSSEGWHLSKQSGRLAQQP